MKPLYSELQLQTAKAYDRLPIECSICKLAFYAKKKDVLTALKNASHTKLLYCSKQCCDLGRITRVPYVCDHCNKPISRTPQHILKHKHAFCGHSCAALFRNAHRQKGYRSSKLEKWLQTKLPELYPNIEFRFNKRDTINSELDIYIPDLKLAFELNGIFHYEPIYGSDKLSKIKNNDDRKIQACLEQDIELCILDVSKLKYFKDERAQIYLDIITTIIEQKMAENESLPMVRVARIELAQPAWKTGSLPLGNTRSSEGS